MFYFHPSLGKISSLTNMFQMGGSTTNQLGFLGRYFSFCCRNCCEIPWFLLWSENPDVRIKTGGLPVFCPVGTRVSKTAGVDDLKFSYYPNMSGQFITTCSPPVGHPKWW